jgi:long-chain-acyl-CoA dehydrogenase
LIAGIAAANAEAMFEITRTYVKEREAFGKPLLSNQVIRHQLADMKTELAVGRAFYDQCLQLHSEKRLDSATASMVKMWMSDLQSNTADRCVQLHGGYGYCWETEVCKSYVDARVQRIYGGTNEIMKELISRDL